MQTRSYAGSGSVAAEVDQKLVTGAWQTVGSSTYAYDFADRTTGITHRSTTLILARDTYTYDANGRLLTEVINGTTETYAYDAVDQLTADNGSSLSYDLTGNRTMAGYATGSNNRMTNDGVWTYTYDAEGNVSKRSKGTAAETWVYGYDLNNHMTSAAKSATDGGSATARVTYVYDAFGNRIERQHWNGSTTATERFAQDGWDTGKPSPVGNENFDVILDLDGSNALAMRRMYGEGFDDLIARERSGGTPTWYLRDHQGSVRSLIDNTGAIVGTLAYSAFGSATTDTGSTDRYRYTAREFDSALGLMYYRQRMYDPQVGRFLEEDEFQYWDANLYRYVGNGPTNGTDPSGNYLIVDRKGDMKNFEKFFDDHGVRYRWFADDRGFFIWFNPEDRQKLADAFAARYDQSLVNQLIRAGIDDRHTYNVAVGGDPTKELFHDEKTWGTRAVRRYMDQQDQEHGKKPDPAPSFGLYDAGMIARFAVVDSVGPPPKRASKGLRTLYLRAMSR